jgi:hypothetical protein
MLVFVEQGVHEPVDECGLVLHLRADLFESLTIQRVFGTENLLEQLLSVFQELLRLGLIKHKLIVN